MLDPKLFEEVFRRWVSGIVPAVSRQLAIDGKTIRGSGSGGERAIHMVSAFATDLGIVLGQEKVDSKSNEITGIPVLLEALYLKGCLVTIDAMGCQKDIAAQVFDKGGDYLLAVKGNQPTLQQMVEDAFTHQRSELVAHNHVDATHGRLVVQKAWVASAEDIVEKTLWMGCKTIGCIASARSVGGKPAEMEFRYYISSRQLTVEALAVAARAHWGIENRLHWMLDVAFAEDGANVRKDNAPQNLSLLRKMVLNILRSDTTDARKGGATKKRRRAAWDDDIRAAMLGLVAL